MPRPLARGITAALVILLLAPLASSQDDSLLIQPAKNPTRIYKLKGGKTVRGKVKEIKDGEVQFTVLRGPAEWTERHPLANFEPLSAYLIRDVVTPNSDAAGLLKLAEFALDQGLPVQARYSLRRARAAAKDVKYGAALDRRIRAGMAAKTEREFNEALRAGRLNTAKSKISALKRLYKDIVPSSKITELETRMEQGREHFKKLAAARRKAEEEKRAQKEFDRKIHPLQKRLDRGERATKKGLNAGSSMSSALGSFRRAERDFKHVLKGTDRLKKKFGNDPERSREINHVREQALDGWVNNSLHMASIYTTRGSFNKALGYVNGILAYDSNNTRALAMRGRIESAANEGWY